MVPLCFLFPLSLVCGVGPVDRRLSKLFGPSGSQCFQRNNSHESQRFRVRGFNSHFSFCSDWTSRSWYIYIYHVALKKPGSLGSGCLQFVASPDDVSCQLQHNIIYDDSRQQKGPECELGFNELGSLEAGAVLGSASTVSSSFFLSWSCCAWCFIYFYRGALSPCNCLLCALFIMWRKREIFTFVGHEERLFIKPPEKNGACFAIPGGISYCEVSS